MKDFVFEFAELDNEASFQGLGKLLNGLALQDSITFDNEKAKGEVLKRSFSEGLFICRWKLTVFEKLRIRKVPASSGSDKKLTLLYVLSTSDVLVRNSRKKMRIRGSRNNLDRKSTRLNSSHLVISYAVFCL